MKYRNKKIEIDGIVFDSLKESKRYKELKALESIGYIKDLKLQVKFVLVPAQYEESNDVYTKGKHKGEKKKGKLIERECAYIADFVYFDTERNEIVVEDTKGFRTKDYVIKRKLMLHVHGIKVKEV